MQNNNLEIISDIFKSLSEIQNIFYLMYSFSTGMLHSFIF